MPAEDATTTAWLRQAGAVLLGKLAMREFALGGPDPRKGFPLAKNPWNLDHLPLAKWVDYKRVHQIAGGFFDDIEADPGKVRAGGSWQGELGLK